MDFYTDEQKLKNKTPAVEYWEKLLSELWSRFLWATRWFPSGSGTPDKDLVADPGPYLRLFSRFLFTQTVFYAKASPEVLIAHIYGTLREPQSHMFIVCVCVCLHVRACV